ncbi:type II toxin-antitoxin system RelE/ParE family toxin [Aureimonas psammosilenae]|uniref:type II toxin-antitoxin system RelE/ParE family toxin n=1 Tax=Aureimonas psammosilenae TaxID=2495496 RepID=UPI001869B71A|nr:type II toxin-antitoxin system RelE/ParE family toxin [Aureimonas psammosilenae]
MRVLLLQKANDDLRWFRRYYRDVFPQGRKTAGRSYLDALDRLSEMPWIGRVVSGRPVREYPVSQTPFLLVYQVVDDRIEVLRIMDGRAERGGNWISE